MADESRSEERNERPGILSRCGRYFNRQTLLIISFGQLLSLCLCGTGVFSQLLTKYHGIETPTSQSFLNYLLLSLVFTSQLVYRGSKEFLEMMKGRGWKYFLLGLVDVEANFLVVKAYQYTNLTSIQVLDCCSLVTVIVLSLIFLKVRYKLIHYGGVVVCLIGVACLITADYFGSRYYGPGKNQAIGDVLVLCGSILYGTSNVAQEFIVKNYSKVEFLGMIGMFGSVISGVQVAILEKDALASVTWDYDVVLYFLGFAVFMFLLYTLMPVIMEISSATMVNLSLLTADFYALLFGLFLFKYKFSALYFLAFSLTVSGLVIYNTRPVVPTILSPVEDHYSELDHDRDSTEIQMGGCCQGASGSVEEERAPICQ